MRIFPPIMNFYWSHAIALQKLSNERSYKFSWILTEVISIRSLTMRIILLKEKSPVEKLKSPVKNYSRRQINLRSNTHGCELIILFYTWKIIVCVEFTRRLNKARNARTTICHCFQLFKPKNKEELFFIKETLYVVCSNLAFSQHQWLKSRNICCELEQKK